jgi:hypothetical protein
MNTTGESTSITGGWTCGQCGSFVPYGTEHHHPSLNYSPPPSVFPPTVILDYDTRRILERIADALEKIAGKA